MWGELELVIDRTLFSPPPARYRPAPISGASHSTGGPGGRVFRSWLWGARAPGATLPGSRGVDEEFLHLATERVGSDTVLALETPSPCARWYDPPGTFSLRRPHPSRPSADPPENLPLPGALFGAGRVASAGGAWHLPPVLGPPRCVEKETVSSFPSPTTLC